MYVLTLYRVQSIQDKVLMDCIKSLVVLMFFVTYVTFQPPSTILIRKIGPPKFLSSIILSWGILMLVSLHGYFVGIFSLTKFQGMGFAKTWSQVLAIRILLGVFAAGYFPGCMYLLSCWYLRCKLSRSFWLPYLMLD